MTDAAARPATIAVASGKGGVGKSTIALNLALALADRGGTVGVLDADLYGPDIPAMVNVRQTRERRQWALWRAGDVRLEPVERFGLKLASAGFLLGERQAFPATAPTLQVVLRQLFAGVDWGPLDHLVVDLPPGTADLQEEVFRSLPLAGALIVVTPQFVAHLDARKLVTLLRSARVRILGAVENMSSFACPHCGAESEIFPSTAAADSLEADGIPTLARLPLEPPVARLGEAGTPIFAAAPTSPTADRFRALADRVVAALKRR